MSSTIVAHNPKFAAQFVTRDQLALIPAPQRLGRFHAPVPHHELVRAILDVAGSRGLQLTNERYAVGSKGHSIFGVLDFGEQGERATSLGFRNSTDQSLALQGVAGTHVFVCDNLAFAGDFKTWERRNTSGIRLYDVIRNGFDMFGEQTERFERAVARLQASDVTDFQARSRMFEVFAAGVLPVHLLKDANANYFAPTPDMTDCTPRNLWGVHNALTRAARTLAPSSLMERTTELGRVFGLN